MGEAQESITLRSEFQSMNISGSRNTTSSSSATQGHPITPQQTASRMRRGAPPMDPESSSQKHKKKRTLKRRDVQPIDAKESQHGKARLKKLIRKLDKRIRGSS